MAAALEKAAGASRALLISAPNWSEVCYQVQRKIGKDRWSATREKLLALPIEIVAVDQSLAEEAGAIKATKRMSLADCFAAALASRARAELLTGDPEFKEVEGDIRIVWLPGRPKE